MEIGVIVSFPLFDKGLYLNFQLSNGWIKRIKPNYYIRENRNLQEISDSGFSSKFRFFWEKMIESDRIEKWLKTIEMKKINRNSKTFAIGSMVYASDEALVFLPKPQGPEVFEKFKKNTEKIFG